MKECAIRQQTLLKNPRISCNISMGATAQIT